MRAVGKIEAAPPGRVAVAEVEENVGFGRDHGLFGEGGDDRVEAAFPLSISGSDSSLVRLALLTLADLDMWQTLTTYP